MTDASRAGGAAAPGVERVVAVRDLVKHFPVRSRGIVRRKIGDVQRCVTFRLTSTGTRHSAWSASPGAANHHRPAHAQPRPGDIRLSDLQGRGPHDGVPDRDAAAAAGLADRVPGPVRVGRPAHDDQRDHRGAAAGSWPLRRRRRRPAEGPRPATAGRAEPRARQPLRARVLRRPAAAHRRRPRARAAAEGAGARRAGLG